MPGRGNGNHFLSIQCYCQLKPLTGFSIPPHTPSARAAAAADFVDGVEAGEDEFDAGGADGGVGGGVDLEGFVPDGRHALEAVGVVLRGQHVADFDLHALAEDLGDLVQAVLVDVLLEHGARSPRRSTASSTCRSVIWWLPIMSSSSLPSDDA